LRREIDQKLHAPHPASGIITEINVPRPLLKDFLDEVRDDFRKNKVELIYRTVRLFEQDDESFLALGEAILRVHHFQSAYSSCARRTPPVGRCFRRLIEMAARRGGTYYLTYHRYASRKQIETCYPEFAEFLRLKRKYDPDERFQSDWYRHYKSMFADCF
jgi:FAD/FMN-containing dehydrogenase